MDNIISNIIWKINKGEWVSPFLFTGKNIELVNIKTYEIAKELLKNYEIPNAYLYVFKDDNESIKIKEIKNFIEFSNSKPSYKFQIFLIENISRITTQAANSLLKFFEEPWIQNIIFITNSWENNVLDTILSRVQIINLNIAWIKKENPFFQSLIKNYLNNESDELISYFFKSKLEKDELKKENIEFLENLIIYAKNNIVLIKHLEELNEDINWIKQNNLNAKYIVDKWILKIK